MSIWIKVKDNAMEKLRSLHADEKVILIKATLSGGWGYTVDYELILDGLAQQEKKDLIKVDSYTFVLNDVAQKEIGSNLLIDYSPYGFVLKNENEVLAFGLSLKSL